MLTIYSSFDLYSTAWIQLMFFNMRGKTWYENDLNYMALNEAE